MKSISIATFRHVMQSCPDRMDCIITCPVCGSDVPGKDTRYGMRHTCCGLHSWGGKPLVSKKVHAARRAYGEAIEELLNGCQELTETFYAYMAFVSGLPEAECHGGQQEDARVLQRLTHITLSTDIYDIRMWLIAHAAGQRILDKHAALPQNTDMNHEDRMEER